MFNSTSLLTVTEQSEHNATLVLLCMSWSFLGFFSAWCVFGRRRASEEAPNETTENTPGNTKLSIEIPSETLEYLLDTINDNLYPRQRKTRTTHDENDTDRHENTSEGEPNEDGKEESTGEEDDEVESNQSTTPTPDNVVVTSPNTDAVTNMFLENDRLNNMSREQVLTMGKEIGSIKPLQPSSGKYATLGELEKQNENREAIKSKMTRATELQIIHQFRDILNRRYSEALGMVNGDGYGLRVLFVGSNVNKCAATSLFDSTVLGIRISDSNFDYDTGTPSSDAVVTEIIDVGGVNFQRGKVTL